jgi:arylsulfatase A-like enzyme
MAALRTQKHKYVHFSALPPLLFDLEADPDCLVNRAGDPACLSVRLELAERLLAWRAEHLDQTLALTELTPRGVVTSAWRA